MKEDEIQRMNKDMLKEMFLRVRGNIKIFINPEGGYLINEGFRNGIDDWNLIHITSLERDLLLMCDGGHKTKEIANNLAEAASMSDVYSLIECFVWKGVLLTSPQKSRSVTAPYHAGDPAFFVPMHLSVEVTSACNLRCLHCYRSAESKGLYLDLKKTKIVIDRLSEKGCEIVEVTGGEPLLHPHILDFLKSLCNNKSLKKISVLTNGTRVSAELVDTLGEHFLNVKLFIGTTIDSSNSTFHDAVRGLEGAWEKTVNAVRYLSEKGVFVRVAMNVFPENVMDIEDTLILAKDIGASAFSASPVMPFGRGAKIDITKMIETSKKYTRNMKNLSKRYKNFVVTIPYRSIEGSMRGETCSAGHRTWVIGPDGEVRPCLMMPEGLLHLGNILYDSVETIASNPALPILYNMQAPGSMKECFTCGYNAFCPYCTYAMICANDDSIKKGIKINCPSFNKLKDQINFDARGNFSCYYNKSSLEV